MHAHPPARTHAHSPPHSPREADASQTLKELQRELGNEKRLLGEETQERDQVIQQLKDTIQEINSLIASEQKYLKKETRAREGAVKQQCTFKEYRMQEERTLLTKKLEMEEHAHLTITDFLARQRDELEGHIQEWMSKYEVDIESKGAELEDLKARRTKDTDKFEQLAANYEALQKRVQDYRAEKQREKEELIVRKIRDHALVKIQRWWRGIFEKLQKVGWLKRTCSTSSFSPASAPSSLSPHFEGPTYTTTAPPTTLYPPLQDKKGKKGKKKAPKK
jgi:hypothetical protein